MIEQDQGAADGTAWQQIASFVFLKGPWATANQMPGLFLSQTELLADTTNFLWL